jgi:hypothetical protein
VVDVKTAKNAIPLGRPAVPPAMAEERFAATKAVSKGSYAAATAQVVDLLLIPAMGLHVHAPAKGVVMHAAAIEA